MENKELKFIYVKYTKLKKESTEGLSSQVAFSRPQTQTQQLSQQKEFAGRFITGSRGGRRNLPDLS